MHAAPRAEAPGESRRSLRDLRKLPRSPVLSKYRAALERVGKAPSDFPALSYFSPSAWWKWFRTYSKDAFQFSAKFPTDTGRYQSVYPLLDASGGLRATVSLAGDWGTGTDEAEVVMRSMAPEGKLPDYTIHLGDVYYIGDLSSIEQNCLDVRTPFNNPFRPVKWRSGARGSFAMNGNHEMYAGGGPYFSKFLPYLGCIENGKAIGQGVSYFCLENEYWRIIGLDTGYHSRGLPFVSMLGSTFHFLLPSCKLPQDILTWLRSVVKLQDDRRRGLILLTHHQYFSAFEEDYVKAAEQLAEFIDRSVLWFWGHEHRMAGYHLQGPKKIQAYGRCIGHGGMPVERHDPPDPRKVAFFDNRAYSVEDNFGWNGYATLQFADRDLTVRYFDIGSIQGGGNRLLIEETWSVDANGRLTPNIDQKYKGKDFYGPAQWGG